MLRRSPCTTHARRAYSSTPQLPQQPFFSSVLTRAKHCLLRGTQGRGQTGVVSLSYPGKAPPAGSQPADQRRTSVLRSSSPALAALDSAGITLKHPTMRAPFLILSLCLLAAGLINEKVRRHFPSSPPEHSLGRADGAPSTGRAYRERLRICTRRDRQQIDLPSSPDLSGLL